MTVNVQDAIVLLGDSITEISFAGNGLGARLADVYNRKFDVVNRGFSGYNTDWIIPIFEQIFPTQHQQQHAPKVRLLTIWFGANDAALPHSKQHVPLDQFQANLRHIIHAVRSPESPYYSPDTRIILITPPPVDPARWAAWLEEAAPETKGDPPDRSFEQAQRYAEGVRDVATQEGVAVADAWTRIWEAAGRDESRLGEYLSDGLHLNTRGYAVVYDALIETIAAKYPEYHYDRLQTVFVSFDVIVQNPEKYRELTKKRSAFGN
ncbi:SGNH hydrolase [Trametes maxima]|nr:SGNH hydrolase [Trametes maxima]